MHELKLNKWLQIPEISINSSLSKYSLLWCSYTTLYLFNFSCILSTSVVDFSSLIPNNFVHKLSLCSDAIILFSTVASAGLSIFMILFNNSIHPF